MKEEVIKLEIEDHINLVLSIQNELYEGVKIISDAIVKTIGKGKKVLIFGNGGSAADAQHIAAEFTGRFIKERKGLPVIALSTDTSAITAIGND